MAKTYRIEKFENLYVVYKYDTENKAYRVYAAYETMEKAKEAIEKDKEKAATK